MNRCFTRETVGIIKYLISELHAEIPTEFMTSDDPEGYKQIILESLLDNPHGLK
jgi:hypothetical protein